MKIMVSSHFSRAYVARRWRRPPSLGYGGQAGLARHATVSETPAVVLYSTPRRPTEHNAVRKDLYAAAVVSS